MMALATGYAVPDAWALAQMQIVNVSDFALGNWGLGDPDINAHIDLCVAATLNSPADGYGITASAPGGFVLNNGTQQLPYSLSWDDGGAGNLGGSSSSLSSGTKLTGQVNANILSLLCATGGLPARLNLKIAHTDLTAALAGTYTGTLTLTLSPN